MRDSSPIRSGLERGRGSVGDIGPGGGGAVGTGGTGGEGSNSSQPQPSAHVIHAMRGFFRSIALGKNQSMASVLQVCFVGLGWVGLCLSFCFVSSCLVIAIVFLLYCNVFA